LLSRMRPVSPRPRKIQRQDMTVDTRFDVRARLRALEGKRMGLETEIMELSARIPSGSLVDKEGFPRADIDVAAVARDRHRLAELQNDHKEIMKHIEAGLHEMHKAMSASANARPESSSAAAGAPVAPRPQAGASSGEEDAAMQDASGSAPLAARAFAVVDEVAEGSPAAQDGICVGDVLMQFGSVLHCGGGELQRVADELQQHRDQPLQVFVQRQGKLHALCLTPRTWAGRGLLGCHMRPLS